MGESTNLRSIGRSGEGNHFAFVREESLVGTEPHAQHKTHPQNISATAAAELTRADLVWGCDGPRVLKHPVARIRHEK